MVVGGVGAGGCGYWVGGSGVEAVGFGGGGNEILGICLI